MIYPATELRFVNDVIGFGVFATRFIPKGTITWVRDELDQSFSPDQVEKMAPLFRQTIDKYSFVDARGNYVLCWDHSRFFNHSCDANCLSAGYDFEVAVRDIFPGEELTDDYGTLNIREPFKCACGAASCRDMVYPDDMVRLGRSWDEKVQRVFPNITCVDQPLWALLKEKCEVEQALKNPSLLRSISFNYSPIRPSLAMAS
ncbi:MAG: SET domain-containing protein [Verrucomicrobiales bacterium]